MSANDRVEAEKLRKLIPELNLEIADLKARLAALISSDERQKLYESNCRGENNTLKAKLAEAEHALLLASAENDKLREQLGEPKRAGGR